MPEVCFAHQQVPADDPGGGACYGPMFTCKLCRQKVCAGYGADDDWFDYCDGCAGKLIKAEEAGLSREHLIHGIQFNSVVHPMT
jgi:hypothetical protein